jgi:lipopolysaccharide/colanic/teichoic acid biosynthesis glycosyltransferase
MAEKPGDKPGRDSYKRWFDLTILGLAHALVLPIWALLWTFIPLLIWLGDQGPVFYKQKRVGMGGRAFTVLKFRTMVLDADRKGPAWTTDGDLRVTRVGRLLRRTGLDELPEILNIWKGEMSLVGPRALDVEEEESLERQIPGFEGRLQVLPGLTGLAQVYDRTDDALDKFRYDQEYLQRMGPWLDLKLLVLSLRNTLAARWDRRSGKPAEANAEFAALKTDARDLRTSKEASVKPGSRR